MPFEVDLQVRGLRRFYKAACRSGASREFPHSRQTGFTLLELCIVVALVVIFFLVAFDRFMLLRERAEESAVRATIGHMEAGLGLQIARTALNKGVDALRDFHGANPTDFLQSPPNDYSETARLDSPEQVKPGHWLFERATSRLWYRPRYRPWLDENGERMAFFVTIEVSRQRPGGTPSVRLVRGGEWPWARDASVPLAETVKERPTLPLFRSKD